jgi:hypothetical protein
MGTRRKRDGVKRRTRQGRIEEGNKDGKLKLK